MNQHADSFSARHITELFLAIYGSSTKVAAPNANGIVLLAAAESQASLHPLLNSSHLFTEVVNLKPPSKDARRDVRLVFIRFNATSSKFGYNAKQIMSQLVHMYIESSDLTLDSSTPLNFTALATQTEGYSVTDLKDLVSRAIHRAVIRSTNLDDNTEVRVCHNASDNAQCLTPLIQTTLTADDFATAQVDFTPLSLRDVKLQKSEVVWADIGGTFSRSVVISG